MGLCRHWTCCLRRLADEGGDGAALPEETMQILLVAEVAHAQVCHLPAHLLHLLPNRGPLLGDLGRGNRARRALLRRPTVELAGGRWRRRLPVQAYYLLVHAHQPHELVQANAEVAAPAFGERDKTGTSRGGRQRFQRPVVHTRESVVQEVQASRSHFGQIPPHLLNDFVRGQLLQLRRRGRGSVFLLALRLGKGRGALLLALRRGKGPLEARRVAIIVPEVREHPHQLLNYYRARVRTLLVLH